jgi:predicted secreted hydrolase
VRARPLVFPTDHGAHADARIEWWYVTGVLAPVTAATSTAPTSRVDATYGFQVTFFRSRTDIAADHPSRFAARQLVFAHAALTDLKRGRLLHDQRIARAGFGLAEAAAGDTAVSLRDWRLSRHSSGGVAATATATATGTGTGTGTGTVTGKSTGTGSRYRAEVASDSAGFRFDFSFDTTQPLLLQGDAGYSQKGPQPAQSSHYYSQPHLAVSGTLTEGGVAMPVRGTAWLDHEWSNSLLAPTAVGWDWIGMNLDDGSALTAFRLRRSDGSAVYAGGSFRSASGVLRTFTNDEVQFTPGRIWTSPQSRGRYPVEWTLTTPSGRYQITALLDAQELDSRSSTGTIYWEGVSELRDTQGQRLGRGYLEMTGYAGRLQLVADQPVTRRPQ